ncbi:MAG TPA: hypothetical protein VGC65_00960 [Bacteroidia bacterium]|jgi:hypothetical protein
MTEDKLIDEWIIRTPVHRLIFEYLYGYDKEGKGVFDEFRLDVKIELIKRLGMFHAIVFILFSIFYDVFFLIYFRPIFGDYFELTDSDIAWGVFYSVVLYLIVFWFIGYFFYSVLFSMAFLLVAIVAYRAISRLISYLNLNKIWW